MLTIPSHTPQMKPSVRMPRFSRSSLTHTRYIDIQVMAFPNERTYAQTVQRAKLPASTRTEQWCVTLLFLFCLQDVAKTISQNVETRSLEEVRELHQTRRARCSPFPSHRYAKGLEDRMNKMESLFRKVRWMLSAIDIRLISVSALSSR